MGRRNVSDFSQNRISESKHYSIEHCSNMARDENESMENAEIPMEISEEDKNGDEEAVKVKRRKPGIIYLSRIPTGFDVMRTRKYFSEFAELGRVYLQAKEDDKSRSSKKRRQYTEGWIEFKSKRKAKWVHFMLNGQRVGGKTKDPSSSELWNIKYLPRMKWAFLNQRLEYEREVYRQRMGAEISQVRQETDHFIKVSSISEKKKKMDKKKTKQKTENTDSTNESDEKKKPVSADSKSGFAFKQKDTEMELQKKKDKKKRDEEVRKRIAEKKKRKEEKKIEKLKKKAPEEDFLGSVFVGSSK